MSKAVNLINLVEGKGGNIAASAALDRLTNMLPYISKAYEDGNTKMVQTLLKKLEDQVKHMKQASYSK